MQYHWPGNVRELFNELYRFCYTGELFHEKFTDDFETIDHPFLKEWLPLFKAVAMFEKYYVERAIQSVKGVKTRAAELLTLIPGRFIIS